jgi:hypothetical protein
VYLKEYIVIWKKQALSWCMHLLAVEDSIFEPGSSVSILSGYGLDDRAIEIRSPAEAKGFFL